MAIDIGLNYQIDDTSIATAAEIIAGGVSNKLVPANEGHDAIAAMIAASGTSLPSQTGNSGKFLTTNGTSPSWGTPSGGGSARELLTANRTYYVRTDGSNSNNGLANTSGGAFLTLQKAYDIIVATLDLGGYVVTVHVADGTYTGGLSVPQPWTGGGSVTFTGNTTTPANCIVSTTSNNAFGVSCVLPGVLTLQGFKIQTTTSGFGIYLNGQGTIYFGNLNFGACATGHMIANMPGANAYLIGPYTISGSSGFHIYVDGQARISMNGGNTITLTGTPAFSTAFCFVSNCGNANMAGCTFTGSATGQRYNASLNGVIGVGGASTTYLPGNATGATATGGQYA